MTTAHRPTWAPAKGHEEQGGARMFGPSAKHSKLDDAAHTVLKTRSVGQMSVKELIKRDFKAELEAKEAKHFKRPLPAVAGHLEIDNGAGEREDSILGDASGAPSSSKQFESTNLDKDDSDDSDSSDDDSDSDEDDTAALLQELERIKKERAEDAKRREADAQEHEAMEKANELASGNPLLNLGGEGGGDIDPQNNQSNFSVKRRWDDDVVFKNQTRSEPKGKKRFVNDTIRSDFHRRFLHKYIK